MATNSHVSVGSSAGNRPMQQRKETALETMKRLDNLDPSECLAQEQSSLFSSIPAEIRQEIFAYSLAEQNGKREISKEAYFYRPDYTHDHYIETAFLKTCRRIYLETRLIPVRNVTFRDYLGKRDREPAWRKLTQDSNNVPDLKLCSYDAT